LPLKIRQVLGVPTNGKIIVNATFKRDNCILTLSNAIKEPLENTTCMSKNVLVESSIDDISKTVLSDFLHQHFSTAC